MSEKELQEQISNLSAKVTALTMLLEALWVGELAKDEDPALIGKHIVEDIFGKDEIVRQKVGESEYALKISDALTSLIDRAVARAVALKARNKKP